MKKTASIQKYIGTARIRRRKNGIKKWAGKLHLWLGMASGIIVFIIAITGCIYVFHDEIQDSTRPWRTLAAQDRPFSPPSKIFENLYERFPEVEASYIFYQNGERPASINIDIDSVPHQVYFNPYSAEITHVQNLDRDFFMIVERLHRFLLLPSAIGKQVTGIATFVFIAMLLTGMVLWWPKKWKRSAQNFKVRWKARWRRKNYDWHRATGFYLLFPALVVAVTGLTFSYEWMHDGLYVLGNLGTAEMKEPSLEKQPGSNEEFKLDRASALNDERFEKDQQGNLLKPFDAAQTFEVEETSLAALDAAFQKTKSMSPESGMLFVWDQGKGLPILTGAYPDALAFDHQSNFYFHPETGKLLHTERYADKNGGTRLQEMNYGLHTGQYFEIVGKIAAFIASLLVALLPVSGFLVWWGRRKKNIKKSFQN